MLFVNHRPSFGIRGLSLFNILIGDINLAFQSVERGISVNRPPGSPVNRVVRSSRLPAFIFLVYGRYRRGRRMVVGADGAGERRDGERREDEWTNGRSCESAKGRRGDAAPGRGPGRN